LRLTDLRNTDFSRILLIKPSAVGDVIHALPVLAKLRARYPSARIDWMLTPQNAELVKDHPALSNVVLFARQAYGRPWRDWTSVLDFGGMLAQLRSANYDLVIDLHGQFRSGAFALVTGAPTRIGFDRPRKSVLNASRKLPKHAMAHAWKGARELAWVAYTHRIPVPTLDAHAIDRYMWLGEMLGFLPGDPDFTFPISGEAEERGSLGQPEVSGRHRRGRHYPQQFNAVGAGRLHRDAARFGGQSATPLGTSPIADGGGSVGGGGQPPAPA